MADEFDRFLTSALAPRERIPDRDFVAGVRLHILLDERRAGQRRQLLASLVTQLVALVAVTAAALWISRAASVANSFAERPGLGMLILLAAFGFVVAMFSKLSWPDGTAAQKLNAPLRALNKLNGD